jgi:hypothetical protein
MGQTHSTSVFAYCTADELSNQTVADKLVKIFNEEKRGDIKKTRVQRHGFRAEFEGLPVLPLWTGRSFESHGDGYWAAGTHRVMQYATVELRGDYLCLCNYRGPAGGGWNVEAADFLIAAFQKAVGDKEIVKGGLPQATKQVADNSDTVLPQTTVPVE